MGVVWQARDNLLGRDVAVKEIVWPAHMDAAEWDLARQRAQREAQMAARLNHPNVVGVYDVVDEDDRPWIIMELVPFRSLRDRVQADGPLTPGQAAQVGLGILAALRAAHKAGVLHRDVKPANVLLAPEGRVVLTDFGIARATDSPVLTGTGVLIGSPSYISPERARGSRAAAAADLWALGACLYAAVEGRPPFDREGALASLTAVVTEEPDPPAHAGPLWPVISGLLRKDPGERLSAAQVEEMLQHLAEGAAPLTLATEATPEATGVAEDGAAGAAEADVAAEGPEASEEPEVVAAEAPAAVGAEAHAAAAAAESEASEEPEAAAGNGDAAAKSEASGEHEVVEGGRPEAAGAMGTEAGAAVETGAGAGAGAGLPGETSGKPTTGPLPVAGDTVEDAGLVSAADDETGPSGSGSSGDSGPGGGVAGGPDGLARRPEVAFPAALSPVAAGADGRDRGRGRERKTVLLAAAAAVVVIVAVVVGLVLTSNNSPGAHQAAPPASHSASASARPSATPSATSASPSVSPTASPSASASSSGGSAVLPAGFQRFTNSTGFSIGVPDGWQVSHVGHYVYIRDPANSGIFLLIDQSDQPQPNALADWKQQAAARQDSYPDYRLLRLQSISYPQAEQAADWEFTYDRDNVPVHILSRNVLANATHAYALYWSTPASDWSADYHYFQAFAATFRPAG
jgi:tRNA A-37 threonylcarbamoyl transferase component Bud32